MNPAPICINKLTLLGMHQWQVLQRIADMVAPLDGDVAEIGVYRGGSALFLCKRFPGQQIHLIDTFEGLPPVERSPLDSLPNARFAANIDEVRKVLPTNALLYKMEYPPARSEDDPLAGRKLKLLHLDVDLYQCDKKALELNWPRMVTGGVILIDDYNAPECRGCQQAVNEFCVANGITINTDKHAIQAWLIKQ